MGFLYQLKFPNGKCYIGITSQTMHRRIKEHIKKARSGSMIALSCAIRKYKEQFTWKILTIAEIEYLKGIEIKAIALFKTLAPNGYNLSLGGDISPMHNPIVANKVSKKFFELWKIPNYRELHTKHMQGICDNRKGQVNTKEHNAKVSEALTSKSFTESHCAALKAAWIKRKAKWLGVPWNKGKGE